MAYETLPGSVQNLYAELLEQSIQADAQEAAFGAPGGSFVQKTIKGRTYWYLQRLEGDRKRQHYLGVESEALLSWIDQVKAEREVQATEVIHRKRLCSMLDAGGAATLAPDVAKVLQLLADSGVFRLGGVLVGTHALGAYANMLGVRFEGRFLRTQDVDIAQEPSVGIALAAGDGIVDLEQRFEESDLEFQTVPTLDPRRPASSYRVRGRELRVDFLTPLYGRESTGPIHLPVLRVAAQPLRFLDYLIADPQQAVVVNGRGTLVNVPQPARFALHKLWTSEKRPATEQTRSQKDRQQAAGLIEVLLDLRPGDLIRAWEALAGYPSPRKRIARALRHVDPALRRDLAEELQAPELSS